MSPSIYIAVLSSAIFLLALLRTRNLMGSFLYAMLPCSVLWLSIYVVGPLLYEKITTLQTDAQRRSSVE